MKLERFYRSDIPEYDQSMKGNGADSYTVDAITTCMYEVYDRFYIAGLNEADYFDYYSKIEHADVEKLIEAYRFTRKCFEEDLNNFMNNEGRKFIENIIAKYNK